MTFRRLALALALLSAPVEADDVDPIAGNDGTNTTELTDPERRGRGVLKDLVVRHDSSITVAITERSGGDWFIPWGLVRLALADVDGAGGDDGEPIWIPTAAEHAERRAMESSVDATSFRLNALHGAPVVGPHGETIGVVRGALVSWELGRLLALAVDVGVFLGTPSRIVAVPWFWLRTPIDAKTGLSIVSDADLNWLRWANEVEWNRSEA
jgi:sporulation protein YlmC with PRC-barrel domain